MCEAVPPRLIRTFVGDVEAEPTSLGCEWEYADPARHTGTPPSGPLYRRLIVETFISRYNISAAHEKYVNVKENHLDLGNATKPIRGMGDEAFIMYEEIQKFARVVFRDSNIVIMVRYEAYDGVGSPPEYTHMGREKVTQRAMDVATAIEGEL